MNPTYTPAWLIFSLAKSDGSGWSEGARVEAFGATAAAERGARALNLPDGTHKLMLVFAPTNEARTVTVTVSRVPSVKVTL